MSTRVSSVFSSAQSTEYVCLNALKTVDIEPSKPWHSANVGRRADCNVDSFRNFLLECDSLPIGEQLKIAKQIELPFSVSTFSGGKSIHFIVSLETPLTSIHEYRSVAVDLMSIVKQFMPIDLSTKNPSRFTRLGGAKRGEVLQEIVQINGRIPNEHLNNWARKHSYDLFRFVKPKEAKVYTGKPNMAPVLSVELKHYIENGAPSGHRNNKAFWVCCELIRKHKYLMAPSELLEYLDNFDLPHYEKQAIISSARAKMKATYPNEQ